MNAALARFDPIDQRLLNDWQRGFPLVDEPYAVLAATLHITSGEVLERLERLRSEGAFSRVGGTWAAGAGGAAMLCALAAPPERLEAVAERVSAAAGVNHNYEREHHWNLWFVATATDRAALHALVDAIAADTGLRALRLPMIRPYRIDLGFDLQQRLATVRAPQRAAVPPVADADRELAAWLEDGLPLVERPYRHAAAATGRRDADVHATLARWLDAGTLRRLGVIVRHHEVGFSHNAMAVFDVGDDVVDGHGARLAAQPGVTLAYRRGRDTGWRYNLFAMVHGRARADVEAAIDAARDAAGLSNVPHERLFSCRRFKQVGGRYFSTAAEVADAT